MFTETEFSVFAFRPDNGKDPLVKKGTFYGVGAALNTATVYAEQHPEHIVTILAQQVVRGPWESPAPGALDGGTQ